MPYGSAARVQEAGESIDRPIKVERIRGRRIPWNPSRISNVIVKRTYDYAKETGVVMHTVLDYLRCVFLMCILRSIDFVACAQEISFDALQLTRSYILREGDISNLKKKRKGT